jgi:hypothetical protein
MAKTKVQTENRKYSLVQFPRALWVKLGTIAAASGRRRPEVIEQVCGPALDQELRRLGMQNGKAKVGA